MIKILYIAVIPVVMAFTELTYAEVYEQTHFAKVNQQAISYELFEFLLGSRARNFLAATEFAPTPEEQEEHRSRTAKDLVLTEILAQEAKTHGINELEEVKTELEMATKTLLAQLMVQKIISNIKVDEQTIRKRYETQENQAMYRFKVWTTDSKIDAEQLLLSLRHSDDPEQTHPTLTKSLSSSETPWVRIDDIDPVIRDEIKQLSVGGFASKTLSKGNQWKVVQLINKNIVDKPPYDTERDIIKANIIQTQTDKIISDLAEKATIDILVPDIKIMDANWWHEKP